MAEVGEADTVIDQGGGGCPYLGTYILCGGSVGPVVRFRDVGDDVEHRGVYPHSVPNYPRLPPCQPTGDPVVESAQYPPYVRRHHPRL